MDLSASCLPEACGNLVPCEGLLARRPPMEKQVSMIERSEALTSLVMAGVSREGAIELMEEMGPPSAGEGLLEWTERILGHPPAKERRKQILAEHHEEGLPPPEPPPRSS